MIHYNMKDFLGTPGPWQVGIMGNVEDKNGRYITESDSDRRTFDENEANNRLISCAPEMLEMLNSIAEKENLSESTIDYIFYLTRKAAGIL